MVATFPIRARHKKGTIISMILLAIAMTPTKAQDLTIRIGHFPNIAHAQILVARSFERQKASISLLSDRIRRSMPMHVRAERKSALSLGPSMEGRHSLCSRIRTFPTHGIFAASASVPLNSVTRRMSRRPLGFRQAACGSLRLAAMHKSCRLLIPTSYRSFGPGGLTRFGPSSRGSRAWRSLRPMVHGPNGRRCREALPGPRLAGCSGPLRPGGA